MALPSGPPQSNPFSSRHVRPGAIPFLFPAEECGNSESISTLVARLADDGWCGEIVGPHGSGKSTLLVSLIDALERAGKEVAVYRQHDGARRLMGERPLRDLAHGTIIVVDGYEQLGWWARKQLNWHRRRRGQGLIVTSHQRTGLPLLYETRPSVEALAQVVRHLAPDDGAITPDMVQAAFAKHPTNLREALFSLYDQFEQNAALPGAKENPQQFR